MSCNENQVCIPSSLKEWDRNKPELKEKIQCDCKEIMERFKSGSFKDDIYLIKMEDSDRVVVVYNFTPDNEFGKDNKIKDIIREARFQKHVHVKLGKDYAPDVYNVEYYKDADGKEKILVITGYAADNGYRQYSGEELQEILNFMDIYTCVDNTTNEELYNYLTKATKIYASIHMEPEKPKQKVRKNTLEKIQNKPKQEVYELDESDKEEAQYYATLLNPENLKNCLKQWFMRCKHFLNPFFCALHELHRINVFHHDLKVENVWIKEDDEGYHFKFIDFGISTTLKESVKKVNSFGEVENNTLVFKNLKNPEENLSDVMDYFDGVYQESEREKEYKKIEQDFKQENYTKELLKNLMMNEMNRPLTLPLSEQIIENYNDFYFFNEEITGSIFELGENRILLNYRKYIKDKKRNKFIEVRLKFKDSEKTFKEFIAERYADAVMEYYQYK